MRVMPTSLITLFQSMRALIWFLISTDGSSTLDLQRCQMRNNLIDLKQHKNNTHIQISSVVHSSIYQKFNIESNVEKISFYCIFSISIGLNILNLLCSSSTMRPTYQGPLFVIWVFFLFLFVSIFAAGTAFRFCWKADKTLSCWLEGESSLGGMCDLTNIRKSLQQVYDIRALLLEWKWFSFEFFVVVVVYEWCELTVWLFPSSMNQSINDKVNIF